MALINPSAARGTGFGNTGQLVGQQLTQNAFALDALARRQLTQDLEQNVLQSLLSQGQSTPQAISNFALNTPFANLGLSRLGSAIGAQQALAPFAIQQAQQGNPGLLGQLNGFFGQPGNIPRPGFNPSSQFGLLGAQGLAFQQNQNQAAPLLNNLIGSLSRPPAAAPQSTPFQAPSFNADFNSAPTGDGFGSSSSTRRVSTF